MLTKGAPEAVFAKCTHFESDGEIFPMEPVLVGDLVQQVNELSEDGFRVLAVATKKLGQQTTFTKADESDLVLTGYLAFLDPPKDTASKAITALRQHGVTVKVLTGDNDLVTRKVCSEVGIHAEKILLGNQVENLTDEQLAAEVETTDVFARLSPAHKKRVVQALQRKKHVVGFMGDGINDAPALRAADVGISVDNAVDIAKESADMILLEKNLMVLEEGVLEGRKVFVNILKYIRMGASSNFGNMFSVLGASAWLPYLPMQPIQVLTNNLLYDFSQVPIPTDNVGPQQITKPRPWAMGEIAKFIMFIGPISSIFDYTTYCLMWFFFKCSSLGLAAPPALAARFAQPLDADHTYAAALFSTGWFVESLMTQTLIVHVIRTNLIPFIQSRASWQLTMTTIAIMGIGAWLPFSPVARFLGFVPLPWQFWPFLAITLCYVADASHQDLAHPQIVGVKSDKDWRHVTRHLRRAYVGFSLTFKKSRSASHGTAFSGLRGLIGSAQASKDFPQPQLCFALGLEILKPPPVSAALKSTTVPRRYCALKASTRTVTPCCSATWSPSRFSSKTMPYCMPEQPPCSTKMRSVLPAFSGLASNALVSSAALG